MCRSRKHALANLGIFAINTGTGGNVLVVAVGDIDSGDEGDSRLRVRDGAGSNWQASFAIFRPTATESTNPGPAGFTANWTFPDIDAPPTTYFLDVSTELSFETFVDGYQNLDAGNTLNHAVTGLPTDTMYYWRVRAYRDETSDSSQSSNIMQYIYKTAPEVHTSPVTSIGQDGATGGGTATYADSDSIVSRGVCWSATADPTPDNALGYTTVGSGTGTFTSNIGGLSPITTYYIRAYATNDQGRTGYGENIVFTTNGTAVQGNALELDGTDDCAAIPDGSIDLANRSFTIEFGSDATRATPGRRSSAKGSIPSIRKF